MTFFRAIRYAVLALSLGLVVGVAAPESASANGPDLSEGCATLHQFDPSDGVLAAAGNVTIGQFTFAAGEQVRFAGATDVGATLKLDVTKPDDTHDVVTGSTGTLLRYQFTTTGSYTLILSSTPSGFVTWHPGCGVPPTAVIGDGMDGWTFYVDQVGAAPGYYACLEQTNALSSCSTGRPNDRLCDTGCYFNPNLSTAGAHTFAVTATDARGLSTSTSITYFVEKRPQTIDFGGPDYATYGGFPFQVAARATSGLMPVTFALDAGSAGVCSLSDSQVMFIGVGTCTILADQGGDRVWAPAEQVRVSFPVLRATPVLDPWNTSKGLLGLAPTTFTSMLNHYGGAFGVPRRIAGQTVSFWVAGKQVCSATTNNDGIATCKAAIGLLATMKEKTYTARFAGSAFYEPMSAVGTFD